MYILSFLALFHHSMESKTRHSESGHNRLGGLLKDQVRLVKRKDCDRYEIVSIPENLSFEKGFFIVIRACQDLAQKNDGIVFVGVAGPSGAGKTVFTEQIQTFIPSVAVISMDNYNDATRIIDGNFDDPRLTDYDTLLKNIQDLKAGKPVEIPIYDFKSSSRIGYRSLEVPSSRIVILEGIYALNEKLRPFLDLRVSVTGGVHFDLVKRVLRDIHRSRKEPEAIIQQISETVYPMYKAYIEPDLQKAHIKITNKFNPFKGFQSPTFILKSSRNVTVDQIKSVLSVEHTESVEEICDIYLLPPGEDPETCQSYLRMRNKEGKYNLMFEQWVTDSSFVISPRITFEVSVRLLGGLMALGYTIAAILKRNIHSFCDEKVCVKIDWLEQLKRQYVQVQGRDRLAVKCVAEQLGLEGSYIPHTYIEQIQLEKLVNEVMALPDDLKTKLSSYEDIVSSPKEAPLFPSSSSSDSVSSIKHKNIRNGALHSYLTKQDNILSKNCLSASNNNTSVLPILLANQGGLIAQLSEHISTLNDVIGELTSCMEDLKSNIISSSKTSPQNPLQSGASCNGSAPTSHFISGLENRSLSRSVMPHLAMDSASTEELSDMGRCQRQTMHLLDNLCDLLCKRLPEKLYSAKTNKQRAVLGFDPSSKVCIICTLALGGLGVFMFKSILPRN
ncbi:unnamed protein product [Cuscuta epithymum]|uniref:CYTH domain-containing protein n=2 Tax=Cuscuta epithymum TaxID=186058 RepID=A0AAV0F6U4_9ASTE|nr:unnamed protein product [Cuscuta epithymum]